jgi:cupin 2 domain-containing protein
VPAPRVARFGDLLAGLPAAGPAEHFATLLERPGLRIVRIVSHGHATADGEWFDQADDEWVIVVSGSAELRIAGENAPRALRPGGYAFLPAGCRHRLEATDPDGPTVWLAIHMDVDL